MVICLVVLRTFRSGFDSPTMNHSTTVACLLWGVLCCRAPHLSWGNQTGHLRQKKRRTGLLKVAKCLPVNRIQKVQMGLGAVKFAAGDRVV